MIDAHGCRSKVALLDDQLRLRRYESEELEVFEFVETIVEGDGPEEPGSMPPGPQHPAPVTPA